MVSGVYKVSAICGERRRGRQGRFVGMVGFLLFWLAGDGTVFSLFHEFDQVAFVHDEFELFGAASSQERLAI